MTTRFTDRGQSRFRNKDPGPRGPARRKVPGSSLETCPHPRRGQRRRYQSYLLCTDGLTNMLPDAAMERTIAEVLGSLDATVVLVSIDRE